MKKIRYISREMFYLIKKHKLYFISPILIIFIVLAVLAFYIGPSIVISFFYAGL